MKSLKRKLDTKITKSNEFFYHHPPITSAQRPDRTLKILPGQAGGIGGDLSLRSNVSLSINPALFLIFQENYLEKQFEG
jgi:hypothetical protein